MIKHSWNTGTASLPSHIDEDAVIMQLTYERRRRVSSVTTGNFAGQMGLNLAHPKVLLP